MGMVKLTEEQKEEQKKIKAFLDMAQKSKDYVVRSADNNENFFILDKKTGFVFIVRTFKEQYEMDFLTKDAVCLIAELHRENPFNSVMV